MPVPQGDSLSDDESLFQAHKRVQVLLTRRTGSEPDLNVIRRFQGKKAAKLRKKWLQEFYSSLDPQTLEKLLKKRKRNAKGRKEEEHSSYKYGRLAMIVLALFSIPVDGWKLYQEVGRTERALDGPTSIQVFDYYSSAITTHVIGLAAAFDNSLILTIGCRMLSTALYQTSYGTKGNSTVPTDPKQLQKYIRDNVPAHRLPKGYRFNDDLDAGTTTRRKRAGARKKSKGKKSKNKKTTNSRKSAKSPAGGKKHSARKSSTRDKKKGARSSDKGKAHMNKKP